MNSKISIIMGIYNCEDTLGQAIQSIIDQSYTNWELIMCDDGSKDNTYQLACLYADKDSRIKVLRNESNLGLNATLNKCLKVASGDYIARQDGDDWSVSNRFQLEIDFLSTHPKYAFVSSSMSYFDDNGVWGEWKNKEYPERIDFIKHSPCFCHAPVMIRKHAFIDVGGYTEEDKFLRCEDVNLWYKLYQKGYKGYNIQQPLYMVRDGRDAYRRRTFKNRLNVIRTEFDGARRLNCSFLEYRYYIMKACKQIILYLLPEQVYMALHKKRLS